MKQFASFILRRTVQGMHATQRKLLVIHCSFSNILMYW